MTVIATDGKSMSGDGIVCIGQTIATLTCKKVFRLPDGRIYATAGRCADEPVFVEWLKNGGKKPKLSDFSALVLTPKGEIFFYGDECIPERYDPPQAIGSGTDFALAAMDAGASPAEAVKIACNRRTDCGGRVTTLHLKNHDD